MKLMSEPFKLYRLQQIDSQLDKIQARLTEVNAQLNNNAVLQQAQAQLSAVEETHTAAQKVLRSAEAEVKSQRIKIEQSESTLYGGRVRNPKELQDLQNEVASLKRYLAILEDRQLEAMIVVEDAEDDRQTAMQNLAQVKAQVAAQNRELAAEKEQLEASQARSSAEREAAATPLPPEALDLYQHLRLRRRGVAVAQVVDQHCSACGSTLSAALLQAARSPNQLNFCDTCGRILYRG